MTTNLGDFEQFKVLGVGHELTEIVLVLYGDNGDHLEPFGSGFFIAPGLVMTAKHVMEEFYRRYHNSILFPKRKTEVDTNFQVYALQFKNGKAEAALWFSEKMWACDYTDIAFLYLKPLDERADSYKCNILYELTMHTPEIGEKLIAYGYPRMKINVIEREPAIKIDFNLPFTRSIGEVRNIRNQYHTRGYADYPCLVTDARFDNGMSGGPVFKPNGQICGVIGAGGGTEQDGYTSFVPLLWIAMLTPLDIDFKTGASVSQYRVYELIEQEYIRQTGWREVFSEKHEQFEEYFDDDDYARIRWYNPEKPLEP